mgnify:CR=1 FL=1
MVICPRATHDEEPPPLNHSEQDQLKWYKRHRGPSKPECVRRGAVQALQFEHRGQEIGKPEDRKGKPRLCKEALHKHRVNQEDWAWRLVRVD